MTDFTIEGSTSGDGELLSGPFSISAQIQTHLVNGFYFIDQISGTVDGKAIGGVLAPDAGYITTSSGMPLISGLDFTDVDGNAYQIVGGLGGKFNEIGNNHANSSVPLAVDQVECFASGTAISVPRGTVPVEHLAIGDLVLTASGGERPVRWLGHRTIDCQRHFAPADVWPVRVVAHAFGDGRPARDLLLSPGHPVLVGDGEDEVLVPIMCLINGTSIARLAVDTVTYWHVELDAHDILLAEGLPAESYLDWGDRGFFGEAEAHVLMNPDFVVPGLAGRCRPVAIDGPSVEAERRRLDMVFAMRLAAACRWPGEEAGVALDA